MTDDTGSSLLIPVEVIADVLHQVPGQNWREIVEMLSLRGYRNVSKNLLNHQLYAHKNRFRWESVQGKAPRWFAIGETPQPAPVPQTQPAPAPRFDPATHLDLYPWQAKALAAWRQSKHRGVVEAVTGAGKTRLALAAAIEHVRDGGKVVIVVPSLPLQKQWADELGTRVQPLLPGVRVGLLGGTHHDARKHCDVLITTASSGSTTLLFDLDRDCMLIADECHRYGADSWSRVLQPSFTKRLGLTATYERDDDGIAKHLNRYFGGRCYSVGYREALDDGVIAQFKIAFVGARFTPFEREKYDEATEKADKYRRELIFNHGARAEPFGEFMADVARLYKTGAGRAAQCAGLYLSAFSRKRECLANAEDKRRRLADLAPAVSAADRTILFSQTRDAATDAVEALGQQGIRGAVLDATMTSIERRRVFASFAVGNDELVAAPKLLDEGIDVPSADLAIILASSRSRRQMIQRMGRVLRNKPDGRLARLVILYMQDTLEDPAQGAHETFLELIRHVATDERVFRCGTSPETVVDYLNHWDRTTPWIPTPVSASPSSKPVDTRSNQDFRGNVTCVLCRAGMTREEARWHGAVCIERKRSKSIDLKPQPTSRLEPGRLEHFLCPCGEIIDREGWRRHVNWKHPDERQRR